MARSSLADDRAWVEEACGALFELGGGSADGGVPDALRRLDVRSRQAQALAARR